ncbi:MAG: hypothetical protein ACKVP5_03605, partial [Aestuariivirga sp.]
VELLAVDFGGPAEFGNRAETLALAAQVSLKICLFPQVAIHCRRTVERCRHAVLHNKSTLQE